MRARDARGFSLMELLVVIAIIAVVAGLIFPIASSMRERGNQSACLSNLQSIGQALKLYRLDEREYPPALFGWLEEGETLPTTFLYPHYVRSRREYKCPANPNRNDEQKLTAAASGTSMPGASPMKRVSQSGGGYSLKPIWEPQPTKKVAYYLFDSYDGGVLLPRAPVGTGGLPFSDVEPTGSPIYQQHYRRDWADLYGVASTLGDRELLDRNPEDSTYVTSCTYHRNYRGGTLAKGANSLDMVLFLDGHTEKIPSDEMRVNAAGLYDWSVTPRYLIGQ